MAFALVVFEALLVQVVFLYAAADWRGFLGWNRRFSKSSNLSREVLLSTGTPGTSSVMCSQAAPSTNCEMIDWG